MIVGKLAEHSECCVELPVHAFSDTYANATALGSFRSAPTEIRRERSTGFPTGCLGISSPRQSSLN